MQKGSKKFHISHSTFKYSRQWGLQMYRFAVSSNVYVRVVMTRSCCIWCSSPRGCVCPNGGFWPRASLMSSEGRGSYFIISVSTFANTDLFRLEAYFLVPSFRPNSIRTVPNAMV